MSPTMMDLAISQDYIGWRNFMEGRVSSKISSIQRHHLMSSGSRMSPKRWMSSFISKILHITHSQWIFRNIMLHHKLAGYLRLKECTEAAIQMDSLMQAHPSSIPSESQFLLDFDTERLLCSDSDTQQYWIAAMQAALEVKTERLSCYPPHAQRGGPGPRHCGAILVLQIRQDINRQVTPS